MQDLREALANFMDRVQYDGQAFVIFKNGKPFARLVPWLPTKANPEVTSRFDDSQPAID